jgi:hypothetical protein
MVNSLGKQYHVHFSFSDNTEILNVNTGPQILFRRWAACYCGAFRVGLNVDGTMFLMLPTRSLVLCRIGGMAVTLITPIGCC